MKGSVIKSLTRAFLVHVLLASRKTGLASACVLLSALVISKAVLASGDHGAKSAEAMHVEETTGPKGGRWLVEQDFALEMTIYEQGTAPQFRIYPWFKQQAIAPQEVTVSVTLTRLGHVIDTLTFFPQATYLMSAETVAEPHSFQVDVSARYRGKDYQWQYDSFEGRTRISENMAAAMGIKTGLVGPSQFVDSITAYGKLVLPDEAVRHISARFPGEIKKVQVGFGEHVEKGQVLLSVQSNESLQSYPIVAPISGVITQIDAGEGEQTGERNLLTITNTHTLYAELNVFPADAQQVQVGQEVQLSLTSLGAQPLTSQLFAVLPYVNAQQALVFRAKVRNPNGVLKVGQFVQANIHTARYPVALAVETRAIQRFRDFNVVYAKVGDIYEVRMLKLGRVFSEWTEVLGGINANTQYVTENSYVIKADIEKSGASHDH